MRIASAAGLCLSLVIASSAQEHKAPAAAASERSESSRSEWGWGPASSDLMKLGEILVFTPSASRPDTGSTAYALQADRGNRKGQYMVVSTAGAKADAQSSEYHLLSPDKVGALPEVDVLGIHYIKVRPDRRDAFERFVSETIHPAVGNLRPDLRLLYYKAVRGPDAGSYITIFALTRESRDKYWPGGSDSDVLRAAFKPVQGLTTELSTYLVEGGVDGSEIRGGRVRKPRMVRLRAHPAGGPLNERTIKASRSGRSKLCRAKAGFHRTLGLPASGHVNPAGGRSERPRVRLLPSVAEARSGNGFAPVTSMDIRYAWRSLSRTPGFSALVILTLALGLGATTTMFSVVWAVFLRPLPLPAQDRIVTLWQSDGRTRGASQHVTPANFVDWKAQSISFEALGAVPNWSAETSPFNVVGPDRTERVQGVYASSGFFEVMGVPPLVGRLFDGDDDRKQGRRRVVISHAYWQSRFAGDPSVVGRTLEVDTWRGGAFTIIGVMPPAFDFPRGANIWLSLADWGGGPMPQPGSPARCCPWFTMFGRLKPGVTIDRARAELSGIAQRVSSTHPDGGAVAQVRVVPLRETLVGDHALTLFGLFGAVGCILLIGSANVANLLLSRGVSRRREVMTRLALGATRWRLARQLLTESLMLGAAGAGLGLLLSLWAQDVIATVLAGRITLIEGTRLDMTVLAFSAGLAAIVSAACGLIPLVDWRAADWSARGQTETRASRRTRDGLAVAELAVAVIVVATAGLLVRTVANLRSVDVGFDTERTLVVSTDLTSSTLRERGAAARFVEELIPGIAAVPGVRAAAATTVVPLEGGPARQAITRYGDPAAPSAASPQVMQTAVTTGYFKAMGIAVTRGRGFTEADHRDGPLVAVVNETAARRYWSGEDPIGKRFALGSSERFGSFRAVKPGEVEWREIVGVVGDIRSAGFAATVQPEVFYSYKQFPVYEPSLIVRTAGDPAALAEAIRSQVAAVNARAVITRVRTLDEVANQTIADPRFRATLATAFSTLALLLGMLGIYGVMSYTVTQRTREIGIRIALGARRSQVAWMVMAKALRLAVTGVGLGLIGAYVTARWISSLFFGVTPADAATLSAACLLLIIAAAAASVHPVRHAVRVEPAVALRSE